MTALWAVVLLIMFPGSLFCQFVYSETLLFLLVMLLWLGLKQREYEIASAAAVLLPLTRGVSVFAVLPIAWHSLQPAAALLKAKVGKAACRSESGWKPAILWGELCRDGGNGIQADTSESCGVFPLREVVKRAWMLVAPQVGWAVYLTLMYYWTGNPVEGFRAQKHWGVHSIGKLFNVPKSILGLFTPTKWHAFTGALLDRCTFILLLWTFVSFTRFAAVVFPMFVAMTVFLTNRKQKWPLVVFLLPIAALHAILVWRYVNCRGAG